MKTEKTIPLYQKYAQLFVVTWTFLYGAGAILGFLFSFFIGAACKPLPLSDWVSSVLFLLCIPLSMMISVQKMGSNYKKGNYFNVYLYWTLPLFISIPVVLYNSLR